MAGVGKALQKQKGEKNGTGGINMYTLKIKYTHKRSWNFTKVFDTEEEFRAWCQHEKNVGNALTFTNEKSAIVLIDY